MRCIRILPDTWASTLWPVSITTRNIALGKGSTTLASTSMASSLVMVFVSPFVRTCAEVTLSRRDAAGADRREPTPRPYHTSTPVPYPSDHSAQCPPRRRILQQERAEIERDVVRRVVPGDRRGGRGDLRRIRRDRVVPNHAVVVRDADRVEKRAHHRPLFGQVIHDEHSSGKRLGQRRQAGEVTRLTIFVEADHRLRPELPLLGDEQRGLPLIGGRFSVAPERVRGAKPLLRGHPLPQAWRCP